MINADHISNDGREAAVDAALTAAGDQGVPDTRQWTIKGLSPEVVVVSREAAKRSGKRLNSWVANALERAAEAERVRSCADESLGAFGSDELGSIRAHLEEIRLQNSHLESTVNSISSILLKLLAQQGKAVA